MKLKKISPILIGLVQAVLVLIYVVLVSQFLMATTDIVSRSNDLMVGMFMLLLLVFSAGIAGFLVFGYFAYLLIDKEIKRALAVLGYTFLFLLIELLIIIIIIFI